MWLQSFFHAEYIFLNLFNYFHLLTKLHYIGNSTTQICGLTNYDCHQKSKMKKFASGQYNLCGCLPSCSSLSYDVELSLAKFRLQKYFQAKNVNFTGYCYRPSVIYRLQQHIFTISATKLRGYLFHSRIISFLLRDGHNYTGKQISLPIAVDC